MSYLIKYLERLGATNQEIENIINSTDIQKSVEYFEKDLLRKSLEQDLMKAKAAIGEIREWKGIRYEKKANGQWIPLKGQGVKKKQFPKLEQEFGTNYSQFENEPEKAIEFLLKRKQGQVIGAWKRENLGKIDITYGNDNFGLRHIRKRHFIEQDDFQSLEDMTKRISDILKNGKIGNFYENGTKIDIKYKKYRITLIKNPVYDEEDNFRDKIWILTSFDYTKSIEDKIRKATSEEIASKKSFDHINPGDSVFQHGLDSVETYSHVSSINSSNQKEAGRGLSFSEYKDMLKKSFEQQFGPEYFEKAKKGASIGTIKEFGGKKYIKTENGWKYYGKKKGALQEEEPSNGTKKFEIESKEKDAVSILDQFASKATDKQLEAAIKDSDQTDAVKKIAEEELKKRKDKSNENISSSEKEKIKEQSEKSDFKKIVQTYVKVGDDQIIIKMKGDNQYKATKGKFNLISEPNESLVEFKKKVKEQYTKDSKLEKTEIKQESNEINFKSIEKVKAYQVKEAKLSNFSQKDKIKELQTKFDTQYESLKLEDEYDSINDDIKYYLSKNFLDRVLKDYANNNDTGKLLINQSLVENGVMPVVNGLLFKEYNGVKYKHFNRDNEDSIEKFYKKDQEKIVETKEERDDLNEYMDTFYTIVREFNETGKTNEEYNDWAAKSMSDNIKSYIDKNPLNKNLVLNRRIELDPNNPNGLNQWITAQIGDVIEDKSFSSFSLIQMPQFGNDLQITLLGKKGDKIANIANNMDEFEYITQRGSKFKVIAKGAGSIVVELV